MPEDISCVFNYGVLKPAAGADERDILFTGEPDRFEGTIHAAVRAAGRAPEAIVCFKQHPISGLFELESWEPCTLEISTQASSGMIQGSVGLKVRFVGRVEVADDSDADWLWHFDLLSMVGGVEL